MTNTDQIAILTDDPGWHGRQLTAAFSQHGFESVYASLTECSLDLQGASPVINLPGIRSTSLQGVFVRGVPGGSLEQVILRLSLLHTLETSGLTIYNSGRAIERTVDKGMTSFLLKHHKVPTPDTWICESLEHARSIITEQTAQGDLLVMKPLFGSQGDGLIKLHSVDDLPHDLSTYGDVFYLQTFLPANDNQHKDWRVFVINGQAKAMMLRRSDHWITNRAQGARCEAIKPDPQLAQLAEAAVQAVDIDYAGVDLMQNEQGDFQVTEVNSIPAWWGLQSVCEFNVAELIAEHFVSKIKVSSGRFRP